MQATFQLIKELEAASPYGSFSVARRAGEPGVRHDIFDTVALGLIFFQHIFEHVDAGWADRIPVWPLKGNLER